MGAEIGFETRRPLDGRAADGTGAGSKHYPQASGTRPDGRTASLLAIMRYKVLVPEVIERMTASRGARPTADEEPKHARQAAQAISRWPRLALHWPRFWNTRSAGGWCPGRG